MGRRALIGSCAAAAAAAAVGFQSCSTDGGPGFVRPDGGPICQVGVPSCDAGTACVNGNCVPTCTVAGGCSSGFYCEGDVHPRNVCAPDTPTVCATLLDCPPPQVCFYNLCSTAERRADGGGGECTVTKGANDQCAPDAICLNVADRNGVVTRRCLGMPACGKNRECPGGAVGSVCNDGLPDGGPFIPEKARICLFSFCAGDQNCHSPDFRCFQAPAVRPYGECSAGITGDPCLTNADCRSIDGGGFGAGTCVGANGGIPGTCQ